MSDEMAVANKEKLVSDLKVVISDTEELLRATAGAAGDKVGELRERIGLRLRDAKERLIDLEVAVVDKTKAAARATDDFVHEEPWKAVGVAAASGSRPGCTDRPSLSECRAETGGEGAAKASSPP
jgi:ElaB/YqjD/DUF883 family membrane-anchored ribosome-binding protein